MLLDFLRGKGLQKALTAYSLQVGQHARMAISEPTRKFLFRWVSIPESDPVHRSKKGWVNIPE